MKGRTVARLAWSVWALSILIIAAAAWLWRLNDWAAFSPQIFLVPGYVTVGAVIAARTRNTIGWLFLSLGLVAAVTAFSTEYAARAYSASSGLPAVDLVPWTVNWSWPFNYLMLGLVVLLFPDGRLPSGHWRPLTWVLVTSWTVLILLGAFKPVMHIVSNVTGRLVPGRWRSLGPQTFPILWASRRSRTANPLCLLPDGLPWGPS